MHNLAYAKEVVGIVGAVVGTIKNQNNEVLKAGDKIYFGDTITSEDKSKTQLMMADETIISVGSKTEMIIDEFTYDPSTQNGKFLATIQQGSAKLLTGKISEKDPKKLEVKTPAGTLGTRGTEFQAIVDPGTTESKVLLIGPGPNNELGLRPGAVEVSNDQGTVLLDQPLAFTQFSSTSAPTPPVTVSPQELDNFNKVLEAKKTLDESGDEQEQTSGDEQELTSGDEQELTSGDEQELTSGDEQELIIEDEGLFESEGREAIANVIEEALFESEGREAIANVIEVGLQSVSGLITAGQVTALLGVTNEQLFGKDFAEEVKETALLGVRNEQLFGEDFAEEIEEIEEKESESPVNRIRLVSVIGDNGLARVALFGGTNTVATQYSDLNAITSGTYTYQATNVNMASTTGTGSGSFDGTAVIDFSARTIQNTYSGNVTLNGDSRTFSYTNTNSYDGLSGQVESLSRFKISPASTTTAASLDPGAQGSANAAISAGAASDGIAHDPADYVSSGANNFHADGAVTPFNVNSSTGANATIALTVSNNSDTSTVENSVNGQREGITPIKE